MSEGSLRVVKVPVPNSPHFGLQVKGHLVECLRFKAEVFQDSGIVLEGGQQQTKVAVFLWIMVIEDTKEETHEFIMVHTGQDFPMFDGDIQYVDSAMVPVPAGHIEMHLFHAGKNDKMHDELAKQIAKAEGEVANDG